MNSIALLLVLPLIVAAFVYLALITPVEMFRRNLATVRFKQVLFGVSVVLSYLLLFGASLLGKPGGA